METSARPTSRNKILENLVERMSLEVNFTLEFPDESISTMTFYFLKKKISLFGKYIERRNDRDIFHPNAPNDHNDQRKLGHAEARSWEPLHTGAETQTLGPFSAAFQGLSAWRGIRNAATNTQSSTHVRNQHCRPLCRHMYNYTCIHLYIVHLEALSFI